MAFSTQATPAPIVDHLRSTARSVFAAIGGFFATVNRALVINSTGQLRLEQVERLHAKTDAELKAMGIARENIVQHVFRGFL